MKYVFSQNNLLILAFLMNYRKEICWWMLYVTNMSKKPYQTYTNMIMKVYTRNKILISIYHQGKNQLVYSHLTKRF